ncbi:MAG: hypothetical protein H7A33_06920 [Deltaproteobacteria bacterium]|nr:hypothetical protein [Deltaproteobacteria bacterium]
MQILKSRIWIVRTIKISYRQIMKPLGHVVQDFRNFVWDQFSRQRESFLGFLRKSGFQKQSSKRQVSLLVFLIGMIGAVFALASTLSSLVVFFGSLVVLYFIVAKVMNFPLNVNDVVVV